MPLTQNELNHIPLVASLHQGKERYTRDKSAISSRSRTYILLGLIACAVVGVATFPWDFNLSHFIRFKGIRGDFQKFINLAEVFAHFISLTFLFLLLLHCDTIRRPKIIAGIGFVILAGIVANLSKLLIPRSRPNSLDHLAPDELPTSPWEIWGMPLTGPWFQEENRSFPSGHAATATAVAIALIYIYPRGRWFFVVLAMLACFQRLQSGAHYVSDLAGGIAITLILSYLYLPIFEKAEAIYTSASLKE